MSSSDEASADIAIAAVAFDNGDLEDIGGDVGFQALLADFERRAVAEGDDESRLDADDGCRVFAGLGRHDETFRRHEPRLHRVEANRRNDLPRGEPFGRH
jgi:hypothetical protein